MNKLFINKKIWNEFSEDDMNNYLKEVFDYFRKEGFPHFELSDEKCNKVLQNMIDFNSKSLLIEGDVIRQVMNGLNLVNYFMPHMWGVKCHNFTTPLDCFDNDVMLKKAILKRITYGDNMSNAGMRKALSWTHGTHRVSNFRPTVAKYIYDRYGGEGNILDFSSGYGGRLLGALSSNKVKSYTGTDPCIKTFE